MLQRSEEAQLLGISEYEAICSCTLLLMFRADVRSNTYRRMHHVTETGQHGGVALMVKILSILAR